MPDKISEFVKQLSVEGFNPKKIEDITLDLKCESTTIGILYNRNFDIEWDVKNNKLSLATSYSNQVIDKEFMRKINYLYHKVQQYNNPA